MVGLEVAYYPRLPRRCQRCGQRRHGCLSSCFHVLFSTGPCQIPGNYLGTRDSGAQCRKNKVNSRHWKQAKENEPKSQAPRLLSGPMNSGLSLAERARLKLQFKECQIYLSNATLSSLLPLSHAYIFIGH